MAKQYRVIEVEQSQVDLCCELLLTSLSIEAIMARTGIPSKKVVQMINKGTHRLRKGEPTIRDLEPSSRKPKKKPAHCPHCTCVLTRDGRCVKCEADDYDRRVLVRERLRVAGRERRGGQASGAPSSRPRAT